MKTLRKLASLLSRFSLHRGRNVRSRPPSRARASRLANPPAELLEERVMLSAIPLGNQFVVAEVNAAVQASPDVAVAENLVLDADLNVIVSPGDFVTVRTSFEAAGDASGFGVFAQLFNADGTAKGSAFLVNDAFIQGDQTNASVAMDANGNFVVTWQSLNQDGSGYGVFARLYSNVGVAVGAAFAVNTQVAGHQQDASVAMDASGKFVIAWESEGQDGSGFGIFARRFDASGTAQDAVEFQVNTTTAGDQVNASASAAATANGDFVIAFEGPGAGGTVDVFAKTFTSAGVVIRGGAGELLVNQTTAGAQVDASAAMDEDGDFAVTWTTAAEGSTQSKVFFRRFDATVAANDGAEVEVDSPSTDSQHDSDIVLDGAGNLLVAWQTSDDEGVNLGAKGRAFNSVGVAIVPEFLIDPATVFQVNSDTNTQVGINASGRVVSVSLGLGADLGATLFANRFDFDVDATTTFDIVGPQLTLATFLSVEASAAVSASDENGNFVVVFQSFEAGADGQGFGVFAQLFDKDGNKIGGTILVNTNVAGNQANASVAMSADGRFVVAWEGDVVAGLDASGHGIFAQRFDSNGVKLGSEFLVNLTTAGDQNAPSVGMDANGNFVVVWESADASGTGIFGRRFNADGTAASGEFQINTVGVFDVLDQASARVDMNYDGEFAVVWVSHQPGIFAQWFDANGNVSGDAVLVQSLDASFVDAASADVAINEDGNFAVVWESGTLPGNNREIFARTFTSAKVALQAAFQVNVITAGTQQNPTVEADAAGHFVVTWQSSTSLDGAGPWDVVQRQFLSTGVALTGEVVVSTFVEGPQILPVVFRTESGFFGTVWIGHGEDDSGDTVDGVHARLFGYTDISGWWLINGEATQILQMDGVVTFINENGLVSEGRFSSSTQVMAGRWGDLVGTINVDADQIVWANGTVWDRIFNIETTGTINGNQAVLVQQSGIDLKFTNEFGATSEGRFISATQVVADDWGGLVGTIDFDTEQILWANGTVWTAADVTGTAVNVSGAWQIGGESTTILQFGNTLLFINERGETSGGVVVDSTHIVAAGWGNLGGTIDVTNRRILWDNGTVWNRIPVLDHGENWHIDHHRPTAVTQIGNRFLFTNEFGMRTEGRFDAAIGVIADDWDGGFGLGGHVDFDDSHVLWNNQTQWNNSQFGLQDEVFADVNAWPWLD